MVRRSEDLIFVKSHPYFTFLVHIPQKLPQKNILWKHFTKGVEGAKCNMCQQFIKTCENITNLQYHLQRKHPYLCNIKMLNISDELQKRQKTPNEDIAYEEELMLSSSTSSIPSVSVNLPKLSKVKQSKLEDVF